MDITRRLTWADKDVFDSVDWETRASEIKERDGQTVFFMPVVEVPVGWDQLATDILASRYLRRAGVPSETVKVVEAGVPAWLQRSEPAEGCTFGSEMSAKQAIHRVVGCWTYWGWKRGYLKKEEHAKAFYDELCYMLVHQMASANSPQWFNTGLHWAYGIVGTGQGLWHMGKVRAMGELSEHADADGMLPVALPSQNEYERPQIHACFIQSVFDNLLKPGGIMDLWVREARLFKYGSGTGTNPSTLRAKGEPLSGGGVSSGLMGWLKIGNVVAGSIKSGGTTRRAAKMLPLDVDHPEVISFIRWKAREELKVACLVEGRKHLSPELTKLADEYGLELDFGLNGEAYDSVDGQNANLSIRIPEKFFDLLSAGGNQDLMARTWEKFGTDPVMASIPAETIWDEICKAAWWSGDPGVQYHTTINDWHTCLADGEINASNPCSEYMFLENTACNLASLNLLKFKLDDEKLDFDIPLYSHAIRLWTMVLDISIEMSSLPSEAIARGTHEYRTLGLGYANLGALCMQYGLPYDSDAARTLCAALTSILTAISYTTSSELSYELGSFPAYARNRENVDRVLRNHARASGCTTMGPYEGLTIEPEVLIEREIYHPDEYEMDNNVGNLIERLVELAPTLWKSTLSQVGARGVRNAQTTLLAPTGTIGLLMGCDTTGIEPDFALRKFKKLAGGGVLTIVNQSVEPALRLLGYDADELSGILADIEQDGHVEDSGVKPEYLPVFDCSGQSGVRTLSIESHLQMMAAAQPFLSGAISKTVNLPNSATIQDVSNVYHAGHELGLKAVALYRDGCKRSQPLNTDQDESLTVEGRDIPTPVEAGNRLRLPDTRPAITHKFNVANHEGYFTVGLFPDGRPGELFVKMSKEGSTVGGMMDMFSIAISLVLQYGAPMRDLVNKFSHQRFEPNGMTRNKDIPIAKSIVDYIFRWLGMEFLEGYREENSPHAISEGPKIPKPAKHSISDNAKYSHQDAPVCEVCGELTVRSGFCYKCLNCGAQPGCG